jgi:hypothetical protein
MASRPNLVFVVSKRERHVWMRSWIERTSGPSSIVLGVGVDDDMKLA